MNAIPLHSDVGQTVRPWINMAIVFCAFAHLLCPTSVYGDSTIEAFTEAFQQVDLAPTGTGVLAEIVVREGDAVVAGQPLALLDHEVFEIDVQIASQALEGKGRLLAAEAEQKLRATRLTKLLKLRSEGYAFQDELERAQNDLSLAEANRLVAQEQKGREQLEWKRADVELKRRSIRSPFNGVIAKIHYEAHEFVSPVDPKVFTIVQNDKLRVAFPIPVVDTLTLSAGQKVLVRFPDLARETMGIVELVSPVVVSESGTRAVKVLIDNQDGKLLVGLRCVLVSIAADKNQPITVGKK